MEDELKKQIQELKCYITSLKDKNERLKNNSQIDESEVKRLRKLCEEKDDKIRELKYAIKTIANEL